jgi:hypothetical protein
MAKSFTPEQIIELRKNPYTYKVTEKHIRFTKEFKELFYKKRQEGMSLRDTFTSLGYDPEVLGYERIEGISGLINKAMREEGRFREGTRPRHSILDEEDPEITKENFRRMQHELQLLRQEMDFIKKISSRKDSGK